MTGEDFQRLDDSRNRIRDAMMQALGLYMAKETTEADQWRDKEPWQNQQHLLKEMDEIKRSSSLARKYHNYLDAIAQAAINAAQQQLIAEEIGEKLE